MSVTTTDIFAGAGGSSTGLAAGMAFPRSYIWEGTKREKVKMAGNAVTPPMARDLGIVSKETLEAAA